MRKIDCNKDPSDCTNVHGGSPGFGWLESQLAPRSASHTGIPASVGSLEACAVRFDWRGMESAGGNRHGMAGSGAWMGPPMVVMRLDPPGPYVGGLGLRGGRWVVERRILPSRVVSADGGGLQLVFRERGRFAV